MKVIMKDEQLNIVTIGDLDYIKTEEEKSIFLKSTTKNKYGYYMSMEIPNKNEENDKFKKITEEFFMREII